LEGLKAEIEALSKRVEVLEDAEEIKRLHREYVYSLCEKKWDNMLECFVEDAEAEIMGERFKGKKEIEAFFKNVLEERISLKDGHIVCQPVIAVRGEEASGHWILYLFFSEPSWRWMQGRQECEYVKVGGRWKIKKMRFFAPWPMAEKG